MQTLLGLGLADHEPIRDVWDFEAQYSLDPKAWAHQAWNLRLASEALLLHDSDETDRIFHQKVQPRLPIFWSSNIERMLMGFSLENLLKALILMVPEKAEQAFAKEGTLRWSVRSHDLNKLSEEAGVGVTPEERDLLDVLSTCSTWAGRYPLPMNENELPRRRKAAPDRETLLRRRRREFEKAMAEGRPVVIDKHDKLHTGIGNIERDLYRKVFDRLEQEIEIRKANAKNP